MYFSCVSSLLKNHWEFILFKVLHNAFLQAGRAASGAFSQAASAGDAHSGHTCLSWQMTMCLSAWVPIVTQAVRCNVALGLIMCGYHV